MVPALSLAVVLGSTYTVRSVERLEAFAGRLGNRVEIRLDLQRGDEVRTIRLTRRHTRAGRIPNFAPGDVVTVPAGDLVAPEEVRKVRA